MYLETIFYTVSAWVLGLLLDANISFGPDGFLALRIVLPVLVVGLCILHNMPKGDKEQDK